MADEKRSRELKEQERHYDTASLNVVFALSSIALAASVVWSVLDDYSRGWKHYQRAQAQVEMARLQQEIGKSQQQIDAGRKAQLEGQLAEGQQAATRAGDRIRAIDAELNHMANGLYIADQNVRFTKALLDTAKYEFEEARDRSPEHAEAARNEMDRLAALLARYDDENKALQAKAGALTAERRQLTADQDKAAAGLAELNREVARLERGLKRLDHPVVNTLLNAPMLDFVNPTFKIRQYQLDGITNDINFMQIPRVDRCQTCHLTIDRREYVGAERPFRAHPNLDLIGLSSSPHPFERVGCTICHAGRDRATGFVEAVHIPDSPDQKERWERDHHWHRMHYWDFPMYPARYTEAGCLQCHMQEVFLPGADKLSRGRHLFETLGCHGCHKVAGWADLRKVGPPLGAIATKTSPDWVRLWLANPRAFRPTTKMPRFWFLTNSSGPDDVVRNTVEIEAVVALLFDRSKKGRYPDPPSGDPTRGRAVVETVGCHGCHSAIGPAPEHAEASPRSHGPNLMRPGSKTDPGWLFQWVSNPKNSWPQTVMPDLRLTEREAADVAAYLASLRDESWRAEVADLLKADPERMKTVRDEIVLGYLARKQPLEQAKAAMAKMSEKDKDLMVGEKTIQRYGCFGCHDIPGFEQAQRMGTELTREGSKYVDQFDFGFVDLPRDRQSWLFQKLRDPRVFDNGKVKSADEKLKMPNFSLSDEEAEALVTVLLGLKADEVEPSRRHLLDARHEAIQNGWRLVADSNCIGCHLIEGRGGDIRPWIQKIKAREGIGSSEALAFAPPNLHTEGAKVQSDWLFSFLKNVHPIRPWLAVRMPSFQLTDDQVNTLTAFFAALESAEYPFLDYRRGFGLSRERRGIAEKLSSKDYLNCLSCHQYGSQKPNTPPDSWAPDLAMARRRLRADWISRWLADPQKITPGTRMPSFFLDENSGPPDILGGSEAAQMGLLAEWVMSLGEARPYPEAALYVPASPVPLRPIPDRPADATSASGGPVPQAVRSLTSQSP